MFSFVAVLCLVGVHLGVCHALLGRSPRRTICVACDDVRFFWKNRKYVFDYFAKCGKMEASFATMGCDYVVFHRWWRDYIFRNAATIVLTMCFTILIGLVIL